MNIWHQSKPFTFIDLEKYQQNIPKADIWGYLSSHYGICCGPVYFDYFLWFNTLEELLHYLVQGEIRVELEESQLNKETQEKVNKLALIADQFYNNELSIPEAMKTFSSIFEFFNINWLGQYKDLTTNDSDFPYKVRESFRIYSLETQIQSKVELLKPIAPNEEELFKDYLLYWGA